MATTDFQASVKRQRHRRPLRVVFAGGTEKMGGPQFTVAQALNRVGGFSWSFSNKLEWTNTWPWWHLARKSDVVVATYQGGSRFLSRQLAIANLAGSAIVRWWIGTDVMRTLQCSEAAKSARDIATFATQIAVSPHLVDELRRVGVQAKFIPSMLEERIVPTCERDSGTAILVYLPTERKEFYGFDSVVRVVQANPELQFIIVADESHSLSHFSNVNSLGWIKLDQVWPRVRCLLRITKHDGMPRMVIDALRRGKHVIYSWPFPGCVYATNAADATIALRQVSKSGTLNTSGISAVKSMFKEDPGEKFATALQQSWKTRSLRHHMAALRVLSSIAVKQRPVG